MKKNALQIITLGFCVILLVMNVRQGRKLEEYRSQLSGEISNKYSMLYNDLEGISSRIERKLEEGAKLVADYSLEPGGVRKASRSLLTDVVVKLKEWRTDTAVELLVRQDGKETAISMTSVGNGDFTCALELPMEQEGELWLDVAITSGGAARREELGGFGEMSMLLPVQMRSWGGTAPVYEEGVLTIGQHEGDLEDRSGAPAEVSDIHYRLYVNGEMVKEDTVCENWLQECANGDEIRLTLFCRDKYGLGYEFTLDEFMCDENAENERGTSSVSLDGRESPVLSWD